jgi:hypothetical protein
LSLRGTFEMYYHRCPAQTKRIEPDNLKNNAFDF